MRVIEGAFVLSLVVAESWTLGNSFPYVISNVLGLANPFTDDSPTTTGARNQILPKQHRHLVLF